MLLALNNVKKFTMELPTTMGGLLNKRLEVSHSNGFDKISRIQKRLKIHLISLCCFKNGIFFQIITFMPLNMTSKNNFE